MTYEETIKYGKEQLEIFGGEHHAFIRKAISAFEKLNPQKPIADGYEGVPMVCVRCGNGLRFRQKYCNVCGQRQDWSDYE